MAQGLLLIKLWFMEQFMPLSCFSAAYPDAAVEAPAVC